MSRTEPAQESSMEEILASIRRIISEDATTPPAPKATRELRPPAVAPSQFPAALATPVAAFVAPTPPAQPAPIAPAPFVSAAAFAADPPEPVALPVQTVSPPLPVPESVAGTLAPEDDDILDLGSTFASATPSSTSNFSPPKLNDRPLPNVLETHGAGDAAAQSAAAQSAADEPAVEAEAEAVPVQVRLEPAVTAAPGSIFQALVRELEPMAAPVETTAMATLAVSVPSPEPAAAEFSSAADVPAMEAAQAPIHTLAIPMLAASTAAEPIAQAAEPVPEVPAIARAAESLLVPEPADLNHRPQPIEAADVAGTAALDPVPTPSLPLSATKTSAAGLGPRSLEDMVADMLKPMLREWLDTNMPRIIEKALAKDPVRV